MSGLDKMRVSGSEGQSAASVEGRSQSSGFATAEDFNNRFKTFSYTIPSTGLTIECRALLPIDFQTFGGSAIRRRMTEAGLDYHDDEARLSYTDGLSVEASNEIVVEAAKQSVIHSAQRPKFTALPVSECSAGMASIDGLSPSEIVLIDKAIQDFSGVEKDEEMFRGDSESDAEDGSGSVAGGTDEHAEDRTD